MCIRTKLLLSLTVVAAVFTTTCFADDIPAPAREAIDARNRVVLGEVAALLDSWRGDARLLDEARSKLDDILRSDPGLAPAHREYARYYIMSGYVGGVTVEQSSLAAAERSLKEALRLNPNYAEAYVLAGHLYFLQNRPADAMNALIKAETIGTTDPWLALNKADLLVAQGRLAEAALSYQSVVESGTKNSKAMMAALEGLLTYFEDTGQLENADKIYRLKLAREPKSAWAHGNYAAFLLCSMDDAGSAIEQFRSALELMNYGMARSGLAAALYRKWAASAYSKQSSDASSLFREAQSLRSGTPAEVVISFCKEGPAVVAVMQTANQLQPPAR